MDWDAVRLFGFSLCVGALVPMAVAPAAAAALTAVSVAEFEISAGDDNRFSLDNGLRQFSAGCFVDTLDSGAGDMHLRGAVLLSIIFEIDQPYDLVFVDGEYDFTIRCFTGCETAAFGHSADISGFDRSRHEIASFSGICRIYNVPRKVLLVKVILSQCRGVRVLTLRVFGAYN